jgi:hypothetical protein
VKTLRRPFGSVSLLWLRANINIVTGFRLNGGTADCCDSREVVRSRERGIWRRKPSSTPTWNPSFNLSVVPEVDDARLPTVFNGILRTFRGVH